MPFVRSEPSFLISSQGFSGRGRGGFGPPGMMGGHMGHNPIMGGQNPMMGGRGMGGGMQGMGPMGVRGMNGMGMPMGGPMMGNRGMGMGGMQGMPQPFIQGKWEAPLLLYVCDHDHENSIQTGSIQVSASCLVMGI